MGIAVNAAACDVELRSAGRAYHKILDGFDSPIEVDCPYRSASLELVQGWGAYACPACNNDIRVLP